ncbi:MAG: hypothetical protein KME16_09555 [Scytolyngbya sp. HA4215-MV1]|nr:hypothetical protein [Scytolyngbya sp. HA4215-MV1]
MKSFFEWMRLFLRGSRVDRDAGNVFSNVVGDRKGCQSLMPANWSDRTRNEDDNRVHQ